MLCISLSSLWLLCFSNLPHLIVFNPLVWPHEHNLCEPVSYIMFISEISFIAAIWSGTCTIQCFYVGQSTSFAYQIKGIWRDCSLLSHLHMPNKDWDALYMYTEHLWLNGCAEWDDLWGPGRRAELDGYGQAGAGCRVYGCRVYRWVYWSKLKLHRGRRSEREGGSG